MKKWQYSYLEFPQTIRGKDVDFAKIAKMGEQGWEMVQLLDSNSLLIFFKRPL